MPAVPVINIGIVDDSERDRQHILQLLERFQHENSVQCQVRQFDDGSKLLENYQPDFDLIFLDIQMEDVDGMRAAAAIRKVDTKVVLIFVTKTAQYATSGYAVQAQSYLLKPVSYFAFETEMNRCLSRLGQVERESILVGSGASIRRVNLSEIIYLESNRHRITVHTLKEELIFSGTLKAFEDTLQDRNFYRSNSGYLLNLQHLIALDSEEAVMSNGDRLKISRSRKKGLLEALTDYIGGQLG